MTGAEQGRAVQAERRRRWLGAAVIVIVALATLGVAVFQPLGGDDVYVLENLSSGRWAPRFFAFDVDAPSAGYVPWWFGVAFQRRFLRVPSSGLLWIEWELFGRSAVPYHLITAALVLAGCLLLYRLALRHVSAPRAVVIASVPLLHPSSAEVVGTLNCQPLAAAGLFCVATVVAWDRMRRTGSRPALAAALAFCALAITSYEAAAVLPFVLLLADVVLWNDHAPSPRAWGRRLGLLAVFVAYVPGAVAIRRGLTAPDTGPLRPLAEVWRSARLDATAYGLKTFGLFDPRDPAAHWLHRIAGEPLSIAAALALLAAVVVLVRRQRLGMLGLVVFASFLVLPWITRATVAQLNLPTLRQLHLPMLLGGPLVVAALLASVRSRAMGAIGCAWLAALSVETIVVGGLSAPIPERRALSSSLRAALADVPADRTIVGIGGDLCGLSPSLFRPGGVLLAIPDADEATPALTVIDAHTLVARVPEAFDVPEHEQLPARQQATDRGPAWLVRRPPPIVLHGSQRIPGANVDVVARGPRGIQALRYRFDRPLSQLVFLRMRGCDAPERVTLPSMGE
ncbi:TPR repeat protein [Minicystis rosea]|nr:TPR repeat protein [Minicystis rosea]